MGDRSPELSIIIPVYNVDKWLNQCLDSIKQQTYTDYECILVDDGSTDFSGIMCDSYAKTDPRFIVVHQENAGVSAARNAGLDIARGSLLSFIDPDDFISLNFYKEMIDHLHKYDADVAKSGSYIVNEIGNQGNYILFNYINDCLIARRNFLMEDNDAVQEALCQNVFSCVCWGKVFTAKLWGSARFPCGIDLGEDMITVPRVIISANCAVIVQNAIHYWRQRKKSLLHGSVTTERLMKDLSASEEMLKQLCEYAPHHEQAFRDLKYQYDIGCYANYRQSPQCEQKLDWTEFAGHAGMISQFDLETYHRNKQLLQSLLEVRQRIRNR